MLISKFISTSDIDITLEFDLNLNVPAAMKCKNILIGPKVL